MTSELSRGPGRPAGSKNIPDPPPVRLATCSECGYRLRSSNETDRCGACAFHYWKADGEVADFWRDYHDRIGPPSSSLTRRLAVDEFVLGAAQILVSRETKTLLGKPMDRIRAACELHEKTIKEAWLRLQAAGYVSKIFDEEWLVIAQMPPGMIEDRKRYGVDDWSRNNGSP